MRNLIALAVSVIALSAPLEPAMAVEQPTYSVQLKEGDFEVRRYPPCVVAEVVVDGDQGEAVQKGFRVLARYIFGANAGKAHISMTAPVTQKPEGEKIAMTAPVTQSPAKDGRWTVQFIMPASYTLDSLPKPDDPAVHFRSVQAREMAVFRFSGVARERSYRQNADALSRWVAGKGFTVRAPATLAQYDPPWTPWFMRRNEVMLDVVR